MEDSIQKINTLKSIWDTMNNDTGNNIADEQLKIVEQIGNFFSAGSYYYYILNFDLHQMEFISDGAEEIYETPLKDINLESILNSYYPEDLTKMIAKEEVASDFLFNKIPPEQVIDYKIVYLNRIVSSTGKIKTILHQAKAINVSENGRIHKVLGVHADITHLNSPVDHKVSFISSKYPSYYSVSTERNKLENQNKSLFTKREIEIIRLISNGLNFNEIGEALFISPETVKTHKRNILDKTKAKNMAHLITYCIREGII